MKRIFILIIFLCSTYISSFSQKYHSEIEIEIFNTYKKDSTNYPFIKSLCAIDSTFTKKQIENAIADIQSLIDKSPSKDKKEKKRVRQIYDTFHKKYFKKYVADSYFTDIFKNGNYNCVTATAMYAYVFDKLNIPYHIKEAPSHVYLIAYPKTYKIHLETTVPGAYGFLIPKDSEIKKIVDELIKMKLVTPDELKSKGYSEVYDEYFYGKEFINKNSLIGMQYFNHCVNDYRDENYINAQNNISKSLVFYNAPMSKIIYKDILRLNISKLSFNKIDDINTLVDYFSELEYKKDFNNDDVKYYLYKVTQNDDNNIEFIENAASILSKLENEKLNKLCLETLYEYITRKEVNALNYINALKYSKKVLEINQKNKFAKEVMAYSLQNYASHETSSEKLLNEVEDYYTTYSFLENNKRIETIRALILGELTIKLFGDNQPDQALKYLDKLSLLLDSKKEYILLDARFYPHIYLTAGRYYYGKSKFKKAKEIFKKGLVFASENQELKKMLKWTNEDMN